jgi:hypothetical protein
MECKSYGAFHHANFLRLFFSSLGQIFFQHVVQNILSFFLVYRKRPLMYKLIPKYSVSLTLADPFWHQKIITEPHILAHINLVFG